MRKYIALLLVVLMAVILLTACTDGQQSEELAVPEDFNFIFGYGVYTKNKLDTFTNTYTKDLVMNGLIDTPLTLTAEEKAAIYTKMRDIDLFRYPKDNARNSGEPPFGYFFVVQHNGEKQSITWSGGFKEDTADQNFSSFVGLVLGIIESHEEYQALPEHEGGYL